MTKKGRRHLNTVLLVGEICKDPRFALSRNGKPMLTLILLVDRSPYLPPKITTVGEAKVIKEPDFVTVVISGDLAKDLSSKVQLKQELFVRGSVQSRNYTDNGVQPPRRRVIHEVIATDARILTDTEIAEEVLRIESEISSAISEVV